MTNNIQQTNEGITEQVPFSIGSVHHNLANLTPTASEIAHLWTSYEAETMAICFLKKWVNESKDPEIHSLLQQVLDISTQRVQEMKNLFISINYLTPTGFGEKDVNINSPILFSESFTCLYVRMMQEMIMQSYSIALESAYRSDFRNLYSACVKASCDIENKATEILLAKGILNKHPSIIPPRSVETVTNKSYFGSLLGLGEIRPLNAMEISHIYKLLETGILIRTLNMGYSQVVKSEKVRNFLVNRKELIDKNLNILAHLLTNEDVPVPSLSEILVTDAQESGLSDKLILNHITATNAFIISVFGLALPAMARKDIVITIGKILTSVINSAKEGADLLIEYGWLEQIPETADRHELTH